MTNAESEVLWKSMTQDNIFLSKNKNCNFATKMSILDEVI